MRFLSILGSGIEIAVKVAGGPCFYGPLNRGSDYNEPASEPRIPRPHPTHCTPLIDRYFFRDDISIAISFAPFEVFGYFARLMRREILR